MKPSESFQMLLPQHNRGKLQVVNLADKKLDDYIYAGRGSILGNPYIISTDMVIGNSPYYLVETREEAISEHKQHFKKMLENDAEFKKYISKLVVLNTQGLDITLGCFCKPKACHCDYIIKYIGTHNV